jgi:hypothetical protein
MLFNGFINKYIIYVSLNEFIVQKNNELYNEVIERHPINGFFYEFNA